MKKLIFLFIILSFCTGCNDAKNNERLPIATTPPSIKPSISDDVVGVYGDITAPRSLYYVGNGNVEEDRSFFIEGNGCIFEDYMLAIVVVISQDNNEYALEIGSHCNDSIKNKTVNGGIVNLTKDMIAIEKNTQLEFFDKVKVFYQFPDGFEPTSYIDYINYGTKIVKISE